MNENKFEEKIDSITDTYLRKMNLSFNNKLVFEGKHPYRIEDFLDDFVEENIVLHRETCLFNNKIISYIKHAEFFSYQGISAGYRIIAEASSPYSSVLHPEEFFRFADPYLDIYGNEKLKHNSHFFLYAGLIRSRVNEIEKNNENIKPSFEKHRFTIRLYLDKLFYEDLVSCRHQAQTLKKDFFKEKIL